MVNILLIATVIFILANLVYFFSNKTYRNSYFSTALFLKLFFVSLGIILGFSVLYYLISFNSPVIVEGNDSMSPVDPSFWNFLYFSGVTMFSVGYGDYVPVGPTRFFALIQAGLGIFLPTAYFIKALDSSKDD
ncbi:potassium channel LctB [Halobacillus alkaliphilus]|uniref:Potassium channel LctB n=1 Tax=Halobacillus alkaliphilus TaxID=396056 RepID=A0A1I2L2K1_9BACI|nr:ion channel [Halobacillus alkaliphilus]SFF72778.1 potassium channel LctB [Halobacillus alkaliphilus]